MTPSRDEDALKRALKGLRLSDGLADRVMSALPSLEEKAAGYEVYAVPASLAGFLVLVAVMFYAKGLREAAFSWRGGLTVANLGALMVGMAFVTEARRIASLGLSEFVSGKAATVAGVFVGAGALGAVVYAGVALSNLLLGVLATALVARLTASIVWGLARDRGAAFRAVRAAGALIVCACCLAQSFLFVA